MAMIFDIGEQARFYCFSRGVDMRKGIMSLYSLIKLSGEHDALSGDVFVFIGTNLKSIKVLWWHKNGFILTHKRLEIGRFSPLQNGQESSFVELKHPELRRMIYRIKQRSMMSELKQRAISSI
ncbi:MAG: IS66 family insertion sequence element accessory protein TnpB [Rikenellaceae bacterium]